MEFGKDWRGAFIRGDNAFGYAMSLRRILETGQVDKISRITLESLLELLSATVQDRNDVPIQIMKPFEDCFVERKGAWPINLDEQRDDVIRPPPVQQ